MVFKLKVAVDYEKGFWVLWNSKKRKNYPWSAN